MHCNGPRMDEFIGYLSNTIKENKESVILAEMADVTPEKMDYLNNPDNKLLDMHLCLDYLLVNYV